MKSLSYVLIATLTFGLAACNKDSSHVAERAQTLVDEKNRVRDDIRLMGPVSHAWSEADCKTLSLKLDRLEVLTKSLDQFKGKDGIQISGGEHDPDLIAYDRAEIAALRAERAR